MKKKGQVGIAEIPNAVMLLGVSAVVGVVLLILLVSLQATTGDDACKGRFDNLTTYNATNEVCVDGSTVDGGVFATTAMVNASGSSQEGIAEVFEQFDLIGLMIGLGVVLVILIGVFGAIAFSKR